MTVSPGPTVLDHRFPHRMGPGDHIIRPCSPGFPHGLMRCPSMLMGCVRPIQRCPTNFMGVLLEAQMCLPDSRLPLSHTGMPHQLHGGMPVGSSDVMTDSRKLLSHTEICYQSAAWDKAHVLPQSVHAELLQHPWCSLSLDQENTFDSAECSIPSPPSGRPPLRLPRSYYPVFAGASFFLTSSFFCGESCINVVVGHLRDCC